jgi:hypothetical protein
MYDKIIMCKLYRLFAHPKKRMTFIARNITNSLIKSVQIANVRGISYLSGSGRIACKLFVRVRTNSPEAICPDPDK